MISALDTHNKCYKETVVYIFTNFFFLDHKPFREAILSANIVFLNQGDKNTKAISSCCNFFLQNVRHEYD